MTVLIYTDGSVTRPREGISPGGWSFHFKTEDGIIHEKFGGNLKTTNNRMELTAAIKALEYFRKLKHGLDVHVISDSQYLVQGASKHIFVWRQSGLLTSKVSRLKNRDLWLNLDHISKTLNTRWSWVRGHNGQPQNERCDVLAKIGSSRALNIENSLNLLEA